MNFHFYLNNKYSTIETLFSRIHCIMFCYDDKFCFINYMCIPDVVSFRNERNLTCCSHFISNNTTNIFPPFFHGLCLI